MTFNHLPPGGNSWTPGDLSELATRAFRWFSASQFVMAVALTPLLVAGTVAEEKARGTLGLILAVRLSSFEIIADKLAARLLVVWALVVAGLPVLALIGMVGGIDPVELAMVYGSTVSSTWFVASLSMLISVHARSASGAIVGAYAAGLAWLFLPVWFAAWLGTTGPPGFEAWLRTVAGWMARPSPLSVVEVLGGLVLFILAAWRLRPVYRAQVGGEGGKRLGWLARMAGLRGRSRPPCGDDPMAWKERFAPESAWLARLVAPGGGGLDRPGDEIAGPA